MWSVSQSQGVTWTPVVLGFLGAAPIVARWARSFAYGDLTTAEPLWSIRHGELVERDNLFS
jgi:hypothetical protein